MTLADTIVGIGCVARDSIAYTGTDLIFLSETGVRSIMRTIQEKSSPINDLSKNVRNDLTELVKNETNTAKIKSVYSTRDAIYLVTLPSSFITYCFDTKNFLQDGSSRVTTWDGINPTSMFFRSDGTLLMGKPGYVASYSGYKDNGLAYRMQYFTNHLDLGDPSVTTVLKKLTATVVGGSNQSITFKWGYDFKGNYNSATKLIPNQSIAYFGVDEYNSSATYSNGSLIQSLSVFPNGAGKVVQTGYETDIFGAALSIQKIEIFAKNGKLI
jgi:hypothetical protein